MLAYFLLAAAIDELPLSRVYRWLTTQDADVAVGILNANGKKGPATALVGMENWADKTRQSVYATAQRMAGALAYDELLKWTSAEGVRRFDVDVILLIDSESHADSLSDWWLTHWDRHAAFLIHAKAGPYRKCDRNLGHFHESEPPSSVCRITLTGRLAANKPWNLTP